MENISTSDPCVYNRAKSIEIHKCQAMVRVTRNTCKSSMLAFVYAPFFSFYFFFPLSSITINVHQFCYAHTYSYTSKCNWTVRIPSENAVYECMRFCVSVFELLVGIRGLHVVLHNSNTTTSIQNQNHLSKMRSHTFTRAFTLFQCSFALSCPLWRAIHFPCFPCVYVESIRRNREYIYMYNVYVATRALFLVYSLARSFVRSFRWRDLGWESEPFQYEAISNINSFGYYQAAASFRS